ncbi:MAG TPA: hypothetical protein PLY66_10685, partial [Acidobacteriota bacterium]|nr:hypothetical protein [Acidobacteriota bacterium]
LQYKYKSFVCSEIIGCHIFKQIGEIPIRRPLPGVVHKFSSRESTISLNIFEYQAVRKATPEQI